MWIASCTKLMTAISVLQCVEKGLLSLDDDISTVLSEWKNRGILLGFEEGTGKPILQETKGKITVRMLLTHQSGMGYTFTDPKLEQFVKYNKRNGEMGSGLVVCILYALVCLNW
jgi:CubicO group peptidase (beta-lactamase class C family)